MRLSMPILGIPSGQQGGGLSISGTPTAATIGTSYTWVPATSGLTAPLTFALLAGTAPSGTAFSTTTGGFPGTPTTAQTRSGISIQVTDSFGTPHVLTLSGLSIVVSAALVLTNSPTLSIGISSAYSYTPTTTGGNGTITWAITNKPSWASFSTSTGALTGTTPGTGETDSGIIIVGTDADGRTVTTGSFTITVSAVVTLVAAHFESFTGALNTQLVGKALDQGGLSWTNMRGATGADNSLALTGTGEVYTKTALAQFPIIAAGYSDNFVVRRRLSPFADNTVSPASISGWPLHITNVGGANSWDKITFGWSGAGSAAGVPRTGSGTAVAATSSPTTRENSNGQVSVPGDTIEVRHRKVTTQLFLDHYVNGMQTLAGTHDFAADSVALNGNVGIGGGSTISAANRMLEAVWVADPTAQSTISFASRARVRQINADGSCDFRLTGNWTGLAAPTALKWTLYDISGGSAETAVANVTSVTIASLATTAAVAGTGTWSGTVHVASTDLPTLFTHRVEQTLNDAGSTVIVGYSGQERPGHILGSEGQSLKQREWSDAASALTPTGWMLDGSADLVTTGEQDWRSAPADATHWPSKFMSTITGVSGLGSLNLGYMRTGKGGSYMLHPTLPLTGRSVGSTNHQYTLDGLAQAGGYSRVWFDKSGQFEASNSGSFISSPSGFAANTTYQAAWEAAWVAKWTDIASKSGVTLGSAMHVFMCYLNAFNSVGSDADWEAFRRFQEYLCNKYSTWCHAGPISYEQQHISGDPFHHSSYSDEVFRQGYNWLKLMSYATADRNGPTIKAVARVDDHTVDVQYNLTVAGSAIAIRNGGSVAASGFDGGHRFFVGTGLGGTQKHATSAATTASDTIRYGFAAATFPGAVSVGGPYGYNPFNPTNDGGTTGTGINGAMSSKACMAVEAISGESDLPLRPYYDAAGLISGSVFNPSNSADYIVAV